MPASITPGKRPRSSSSGSNPFRTEPCWWSPSLASTGYPPAAATKPSAKTMADGRSRSKTSSPMSSASRNRNRRQAPVFAALGDETRLSLVIRLSSGEPRSISQLTEGTSLTRQAITKHLRVLERAGVVRGIRAGRESLFAFDPKPIDAMRQYLEEVSRQWDQPLARLKAFVEK